MDKENIPYEKVEMISRYKLRSSLKKSSKDPLGNLDISEESRDITLAPPPRRVSFAASSTVKPFVDDPDRNTIWDNTYEEVINSHTESNNAISLDVESDLQRTKGNKVEVNFNETVADIGATLCESDSMELTECFDNVHVENNYVLTRTISEITNMELTCQYGPGNIIVCTEDIDKCNETLNTRSVYQEMDMSLTCKLADPVIFKNNQVLSCLSSNVKPNSSNIKTSISRGDDVELSGHFPQNSTIKNQPTVNQSAVDMDFTCQSQPQISIKSSSTFSKEPVGNQTIVDMSFTCKFDQIAKPQEQLVQQALDLQSMSNAIPSIGTEPSRNSSVFPKNYNLLNEDMEITCKFPQKSINLPRHDATSSVSAAFSHNPINNNTINENMKSSCILPQKIFQDNITATENLELPQKSIVSSEDRECIFPERSVQFVIDTSIDELRFPQHSSAQSSHVNIAFDTQLPSKSSFKSIPTDAQADLIHNSLNGCSTEKPQSIPDRDQQESNKEVTGIIQHSGDTSKTYPSPKVISKLDVDHFKEGTFKDGKDGSTIDLAAYGNQQPRPSVFNEPILVKEFGNIPIAIDCTDMSIENIGDKINVDKKEEKSIINGSVACASVQDKTYDISSKENKAYILPHHRQSEEQYGEIRGAMRSLKNVISQYYDHSHLEQSHKETNPEEILSSNISRLENEDIHLENLAETKCDLLSDILTEESLKDELTNPVKVIYTEPLCKPSLSLLDFSAGFFSLRSTGKKTPFRLSSTSTMDGTQQLIEATFSKQKMEDSSELGVLENSLTGTQKILNKIEHKIPQYRIPQIDFKGFRELLAQYNKLKHEIRQHMEQKQRPSPRRSILDVQVKRLSMLSSSFTNNSESISDFDEDNQSIQLDKPKSQHEKISDVFHNAEDRLLKLEREQENKYVFSIFSGATCISVELHPDDGRVIDIDSIITLCDESKSIFQSLYAFIGNYLLGKLQMSSLRSSLGTVFDMLSLLDYMTVITEKCFDFCGEFIKAQRLYKTLNIQEDFTVSFEILQINPPVRWNIEFKMASIENFQQNSVKAQSNYGQISEEQMNTILMNTEPGIDCIGKFVESVLSFYKRTVMGRQKFKGAAKR